MIALPLPAPTTVALLTLGTALVYVEFNRPGSIVPGALGLGAWLVGLASVLRGPHAVASAGALVLGYALLYSDLRRPHPIRAGAAAFVLAFAFVAEALGGGPIDLALALGSALLLAAGTHWLNGIACRARRNKGLD